MPILTVIKHHWRMRQVRKVIRKANKLLEIN